MSLGIVACGALSRDLVALKTRNNCTHWHLYCLPPELHNHPSKIAPAVEAKLAELRARHDELFVAYADCGTGGAIDVVVEKYGATRLPGAHCYATFAGLSEFDQLMEQEPGTFFLTDFLVRHFDRLVFRALGLDRFPHLRDTFFANYRRVVYLAQKRSPKLEDEARRCAQRLGLEYHRHFTSRRNLQAALTGGQTVAW